ncbi:MAG: 16S rRNA (adenine(1518)-N(6)/adenine(1519)-N(6))-dimethyltransferase RsmA [Thiobacillaceae bacterium]|jgi:16S rRNA (adenine1518-N6/adenine1519-N6)-dimethyltransferase|nr:16S rRNA (adenine(1518)-N(6)/adenine(1519)-N(6))-dimethyltransferase RsmA [Hydrogenophilales bacterium]MBP8901334.1 16S rRNA (adenine(1518)-N(6)/adenine(1519)-N(6))-dimethyltransferase RsmA [Thiobacillaceae bacterium]MBP9915253.1 16S rRNA (adenine(1518)-N(6)/adenine(1519)-N(6))-dimethyltransferase RsmA [Thiobacillaceae bacterium]
MSLALPQAKKSLGQHFLVDNHYIQRIVAAIRPQAGDRMVEIGPGPGALTRPLLESLGHLDVVELDRDMVARLQAEFPSGQLTIHQADALRFAFGDLGPDLRVVGNLPYNISSPLLFHLAEYASGIRDMCFMLQKEVVDRMAAAPGTPDYGRLSVMLQARFRVDKLFTVPPGAFRPPPKVDSAIARLAPLPEAAVPYREHRVFAEVVARAFGQRRKTLRNTLRGLVDEPLFAELGIDPARRGETLSVAEFAALANRLPGNQDQRGG